MDPLTLKAYEQHGADFARRYRSGQRVPIERLKFAFPSRSKIMEIGVGSGIDMARLLDEGYDISGIEPSSMLLNEAITHFPQLSQRLHEAALPLEEAFLSRWRARFSGILCSAVLMHLKEAQQQTAMHQLCELLEPQGRLVLTVSATRDGLNDERRDEFGRLYAYLPALQVEKLLVSADFNLVQTWENDDQWHRRGLRWTTYLAERCPVRKRSY
jgi:hypothetical protein